MKVFKLFHISHKRVLQMHRFASVFFPIVMVAILAAQGVAETRSAKDMAKECRVALDLLQGHVEKSFDNTLFAGECIGYIQGAGDASLAMADNVKWFKVCIPDSASTMILIQKFIAFVDKNPRYTLASTAFQL